MAAFRVLFSSITSKYCFSIPKEFANMIRRSLFQAFGRDKENYECKLTTYKQNEPSIVLLVDSKRLD